jgi:acetolactate synthase-1/3 small subunit
MARTGPTHHTLSVLVENTPGVLTRVASLFARRSFNIESLAVGPTERSDRSCITIRVDASEVSIDQVMKQLYKLVNVLKVNQMTTEDSIERELLLVKVTANADKRGELIHLAEVFGARVSDVGSQALVFEIVEHPDKLESFEELLRPYGIKETVRTGRIAMRRAHGERRDRDAGRMRVLA